MKTEWEGPPQTVRATLELELELREGPLPKTVLDLVEAGSALLSLCELHGVEHRLRFATLGGEKDSSDTSEPVK